MTAPAVAETGVAGDLVTLREWAEELAERAAAEPGHDENLVAACRSLRDALSPLLAVVEGSHRPKQGESRHRAVRALSAASMHLGRAGRDVSVERGCRLAAGDLAVAVEMLGAPR